MLKTAMIFAMSCIVGSAYALTPDSDVCIKRDFSYFQWSTETACELSRSQMAGDSESAIIFDTYCPSEEGSEYTSKGKAVVMPTGVPDVYWIVDIFDGGDFAPFLAGVCDD
jgi:hypothetical protein